MANLWQVQRETLRTWRSGARFGTGLQASEQKQLAQYRFRLAEVRRIMRRVNKIFYQAIDTLPHLLRLRQSRQTRDLVQQPRRSRPQNCLPSDRDQIARKLEAILHVLRVVSLVLQE